MEYETNLLLAFLTPGERERLHAEAEFKQVALGEYIYKPGDTMQFAFFPANALVSLLYVLEDGTSTEMAVVGREGMVGVPLILGGNSTTGCGLVQSAGSGWAIRAEVLQLEFTRRGSFSERLLLYAQALMTQLGQTAVCNRHHTLAQQLCRWLLLSLDRIGGTRLEMTQELIANMLGVRRGGVTEAALRLQNDGLIRYSRGHIDVLDRAELERRCCECYQAVRTEYDRLLGPIGHRL